MPNRLFKLFILKQKNGTTTDSKHVSNTFTPVHYNRHACYKFSLPDIRNFSDHESVTKEKC